MVYLTKIAIAASALLSVASAHPHHNAKEEAMERRAAIQQMSKRSLAHCSEKLKARGLEAKAIARREAWANDIRKRHALESKPMLKARDLNSTLTTDHESSLAVTQDSDPSLLFTNNASCVLQPEVTQGPYYVAGELIRSDVRENQTGVTLYADIQFLDVDTCDPVPSVYMDWWHCNATGVYGGIVASGNGDSSDETNLDNTFLRGIQQTDSDGVLQVTSIFPGHYSGRATHVHLLAHSSNYTVNTNGTLSGSSAVHVGQIFFDQDLISTVEATSPYSTNTQTLTENADDSILGEEAADMDPFMEYVLLGDSVSDGIFAWIALGINTSASAAYDVTAAATLTEDGGVANADGFGGPGGNGTTPSGSGFPSSSTSATATTAAKKC